MKRTLSALAIAAVCAADADAATTARELQLMARAVGFVSGLPRGVLDVAVVDGAGADGILAQMNAGVSASGITLRARRVSLAQLAESGVRVIIVPEGQSASHAAIAQAAQRLDAVTISTDLSCVRAGRCVVGVASQPRVEIIVSRTAAAAADISFGQAFRVMIREI